MTDPTASSVEPLETTQWAPELKNVNDDMNGLPINVHKLMAHNPQLLNAWWNFRNYSVNGGMLGQRLGEFVILRVGVHLGAWYEWASHVDRATRIGMDRDTIFQALRPDPDLPRLDVLVLQAVDQLMTTHRIQDPTRAELEQHLTTAQMMDIIAIQGMYVILGGFINTWTLKLDEAVADRIKNLTNHTDFETAAATFQRAIRPD